ncbi:MAG: hypothetical protein ACQCN6_05395 [Candidatus Bathyarchaeia archaeon]|jgi:hypothetical protein
MTPKNKVSSLILILILAASSLMLIQTAFAQIPKPSVPEFTAKFIDHSYDVPTTTSTDPYTGQYVTSEGYHVQNYTVELIIENQPFTPIEIKEGTAVWTADLYYNVRFKGHFTNEWVVAFFVESPYPKHSNSTFTVLTFGAFSDYRSPQIVPGGQIDFQVQALIGYGHRVYDPSQTEQIFMWPWVFTGETSDWSNTQTVTIPNSSESASPTPTTTDNPTATPYLPDVGASTSQGGVDWTEIGLFAALGVIIVLLATILIMPRKRNTRVA